jgi:hypothetical protein
MTPRKVTDGKRKTLGRIKPMRVTGLYIGVKSHIWVADDCREESPEVDRLGENTVL